MDCNGPKYSHGALVLTALKQQSNIHPSMVTLHWNTHGTRPGFVVPQSKRIMFLSYIFARRMAARIPTNLTLSDAP